MTAPRESTIEAACVAYALKQGCYPIKLAMTTTGLPDRAFLLPRGYVWLVEFKSHEGQLRPRQRLLFNQFAQLGHVVAVVRSTEQFKLELQKVFLRWGLTV